LNKYAKEYRKSNLEKEREYHNNYFREWKKKNPERYKAIQERRKRKKLIERLHKILITIKKSG
jgi:Asp-tRNA(Asn)/Glu-tRNA(Gln) amidotransferase A subunit family amidase